MFCATLVAGCGGSGSLGRSASEGTTSESTRTEPATSDPVTGTARDDDGDEVAITIGLGEPKPVSELSDPALDACEQTINGVGSSPSRSVAVPVHVTMTVTSSLAADVVLSLNQMQLITSSGSHTTPNVLWAANYSTSGPDCGNDALGAGTVHWDAEAATPDSDHSWNAWIVALGAITPRDPSGLEVTQRLVFSPLVRLSNNLAGYRFDASSSPRVVDCAAYDPAAGSTPYIAVDPDGALAAGCSPHGGQADATDPTSDAECTDALHGGNSRTVNVKGGHKTLYDRQASVFQVVCAGFGAPEGLELTQGMRCALLGAVATYVSPAAAEGAKDLCDVDTVVEAYNSGDWIGTAEHAAASKACGYVGEVFAGSAGLFASGATAETGPGAVAIGVATYKALSSTLKVTCGGLFDGGASSVGKKLEADHESHVAVDVIRNGACLTLTQVSGRTSWRAEACS